MLANSLPYDVENGGAFDFHRGTDESYHRRGTEERRRNIYFADPLDPVAPENVTATTPLPVGFLVQAGEMALRLLGGVFYSYNCSAARVNPTIPLLTQMPSSSPIER